MTTCTFSGIMTNNFSLVMTLFHSLLHTSRDPSDYWISDRMQHHQEVCNWPTWFDQVMTTIHFIILHGNPAHVEAQGNPSLYSCTLNITHSKSLLNNFLWWQEFTYYLKLCCTLKSLIAMDLHDQFYLKQKPMTPGI